MNAKKALLLQPNSNRIQVITLREKKGWKKKNSNQFNFFYMNYCIKLTSELLYGHLNHGRI